MMEQHSPHIQPARRLTAVSEYYFSRKLKEVARLNAEGRDIISLAIGSPDMPPSQATIDTLCREAAKPEGHGYQPTMGTPRLRQAMAGFYRRWYGVDLDPATEVLPVIGSKEGILHTTLAFADPGQRVLVPNPGYPTYTSLSRLLGMQVVPYELREENRWQPHLDALERTDLTGVKLMWVNYPHMPTGAPAQPGTLERLVDFGRRHGILIVNDNPYSFILNRGAKLSLLQVPGAKDCCLELNSMSKSHNMPGWRVGMLCGSEEHVAWVLRVKSHIDSGTFRAMQLAAATALDNDEEWHARANVETYARRRHLAGEVMRSLGCTYDEAQVGMFLWGRIPERWASAREMTQHLLSQARVFVAPGSIFGSAGERYVRLSLCAGEDKFREALERVRELQN